MTDASTMMAALFPKTVAAQPTTPAAQPAAFAQPVPSAAQQPAQGVPGTPAGQAAATSAPVAPNAEPPAREEVNRDVAALALFGDQPQTRGRVDWAEPAANAKDIKFDTGLAEHVDRTAQGDAERAQLAEAMAEAGAGPTLARELYHDASAAASPNYKPYTQAQGEAELRKAWGGAYDKHLGAAREVLKIAAAKDPQIIPFLERTGLGNDPTFIRKVAARAAKRR